MPSGRPDNVIAAIRNGFNGRTVWPKASAGAEAHYQKLGVIYNYLVETPEGFVLTDLGTQETMQA